jgi:hypothetical protein
MISYLVSLKTLIHMFTNNLKPYHKWIVAITILLFASVANAQNTAGGLQNLVTQIKLIANIIFIGAIIWAAVRTVISFAGGSPTAMRNVIYTIVIALFWFGFNYFVDDVATAMGGTGADQYMGQ